MKPITKSLASLCLLAALVSGAGAQDVSEARPDHDYPSVIATAVEHFAAGRWQEAHDAFAQAHLLQPNARTLRGMGMALFNLNQLARARRSLSAALKAQEKPLSVSHREQVRQLLEKIAARTARISVRPSPASAVLRVDGQSPELQEGALILEPGDHLLTLDAPGHAPLRHDLQVQAGEDRNLSLTLKPTASAPAAPGPEVPAAGPAAVAPTGPNTTQLVLIVAGGAALVGGLITAVLTDARDSDLDSLCPERVCDPDDRDRAEGLSDEIQGLAITTDVLLLLGIGSAATGLALWMTDPSQKPGADLDLACASDGCVASVAGRF